jgi:hypothetical protein
MPERNGSFSCISTTQHWNAAESTIRPTPSEEGIIVESASNSKWLTGDYALDMDTLGEIRTVRRFSRCGRLAAADVPRPALRELELP